jgi:RsmE family RNA methyltransferase
MKFFVTVTLAITVMISLKSFAWSGLPPKKIRSGGSSGFHSLVVRRLNRFLFDESEIMCKKFDDQKKVVLPIDDYRTIHAAKTLSVRNGDLFRCGIVSSMEHGGLVTDEATIQWIPEGKVKKAEPLANGSPPGSLEITLNNLKPPVKLLATSPVSLILALPRPISLNRMLPMISQMGIDTLVLTDARKVPKEYFGSHLFRKPHLIHEQLIEGLCQSGDVKLPKVMVTRNLSSFLKNELDEMFPVEQYARVIAHPQRPGDTTVTKLRDVHFPCPAQRRIVIAIGPEGGWEEPEELSRFVTDHGFIKVSMGMRVLRSDCAVISLLALAHDACTW